MILLTPPSLFSTVFKIITFGSLVSLWWDGENYRPYIVIEGDESKSIIYSGIVLGNWDNQYNPLFRHNFANLQIFEPNQRINITSIDDGLELGFYQFDTNGCSLLMDRLIVTDPTTGDGMFIAFQLHTIGESEERYHVLKYEVTEIIVPDDYDEESEGL